jgi:hypothetical protein
VIVSNDFTDRRPTIDAEIESRLRTLLALSIVVILSATSLPAVLASVTMADGAGLQ